MGERLITFTGATVLVGLLFGAGPAWAGDAPVWKPTRFEIEARYFVVNEVEGASLVNGPVEGSSLDLVRDTGLDEKDNLDLRFNVRTGEAGRVRFAFGRLDFEGVGTVDRPVFWQGAFFQAGTDVASTLRQQYYRAEWIGQFIRLGDGVFRAGTAVNLHGTVARSDALTGPSLYFRWYSSLNPDVFGDHYSLNQDALLASDLASPFELELPMGTQAIAFAASDQPGEDQSAFDAITLGTVTGGTEGDSPCVIHVLKAEIRQPKDGDQVAARDLVLRAEAPWAWGQDGYHLRNRLAYAWRLEPNEGPPGRPTYESGPLGRTSLVFCSSDSTLAYAVGEALGDKVSNYIGSYRIKLAVLAVSDTGAERDRVEAVIGVTLS